MEWRADTLDEFLLNPATITMLTAGDPWETFMTIRLVIIKYQPTYHLLLSHDDRLCMALDSPHVISKNVTTEATLTMDFGHMVHCFNVPLVPRCPYRDCDRAERGVVYEGGALQDARRQLTAI